MIYRIIFFSISEQSKEIIKDLNFSILIGYLWEH